ncbi:MAG: DUF2070 family protein [Desulfurococcales archaeon]
MARRFEQSFKMLLGRSTKKLAFIALGISIAFSILRGTLVYFGELAFTSLMLLASRNSALNLRRILSISSVVVATAAMVELVLFRPPFSLFLMVPSITSLVILSISPGSYMYTVPFVASAIIYSKISEKAVIGSLVLLFGLFIVKYVSKRLAYGVDPFFLFGSFVESLFGKSDSFEKVLDSFSETKNVELFLFRINGDPPTVVIVSNVHPGPFKNVSGAKLVRMLKERLEGLGYNVIFFHGVGGHESDPATVAEVEKLVDRIASALTEKGWVKCDQEGSSPFTIEKGDVKITGFSLSGCPPLILLSRRQGSMDDIPRDFVANIENLPGILVDAQNKFDGEVYWDSKVADDLKAALSELPTRKCHPKLGYASVPVEELDPSENEIGPLGMKVFAIECGSTLGAFAVIDGNNMKEDARKELEKAARDAGFEVVEIATTDNHESTGGSKGRGYKIIGEFVPISLLREKFVSALKSSRLNISEREVEFLTLRVNMKIMGERGLRLFEKLVEKVKVFEALIAAYLVFALAISILF